MTAGVATARDQSMVSVARAWMRDRPLVALFVLLAVLVLVLQIVQPGIVTANWVSTTLRFAIPLAIIAACQTLTMLTGGIDLSVAVVASMAAYVMATNVSDVGWLAASLIALLPAALVGLVNGIGVGIFRVHPLIMTISMGLVVSGAVNVYSRANITGGTRVPPEIAWLGGQTLFGFLPNSLLLFVPLAALILFGLRRFGYGRLLYAVGDNETAARLAGVRVSWVLVVLYMISGILAGVAGLLFAGVIGSATGRLVDPYLLPSVAAVVIGGTSIFGGRGGYAGTIVGALILTVLTTLLNVLGRPRQRARSCSARSSSRWPRHTRGSPRRPDPAQPLSSGASIRVRVRLRWDVRLVRICHRRVEGQILVWRLAGGLVDLARVAFLMHRCLVSGSGRLRGSRRHRPARPRGDRPASSPDRRRAGTRLVVGDGDTLRALVELSATSSVLGSGCWPIQAPPSRSSSVMGFLLAAMPCKARAARHTSARDGGAS